MREHGPTRYPDSTPVKLCLMSTFLPHSPIQPHSTWILLVFVHHLSLCTENPPLSSSASDFSYNLRQPETTRTRLQRTVMSEPNGSETVVPTVEILVPRRENRRQNLRQPTNGNSLTLEDLTPRLRKDCFSRTRTVYR